MREMFADHQRDSQWTHFRLPGEINMASQAHELSLKWMKEDANWIPGSVEQTIRYPDKENFGKWKMFKRDLYNIADYVAIDSTGKIKGTIYLQFSVGMNNKSVRVAKITASPHTKPILRAGNRIEIHIWRKMGKRGARKFWKLHRFCARLDEFGDIEWFEVVDEGDAFEPVQVGLGFGDSAPAAGRVLAARKQRA